MSGTTKIKFKDIELLENMRTVPGDIEEMKKSLEAVGQLQPFIIQWKHWTATRPTDGKKVSSRYFLLDGYTRYLAMQRIQKEHPKAHEEVDVVLKKCNDAEAQMIMLAANTARNNFCPTDTANGILRLRRLGYKIKDIAERIGKSVGWCEKLIQMNESLAKPVLEAVARGDVTFNAASTWMKLPEEKQVAALASYGVTKAAKGRNAARRQADRDSGKPERPMLKTIAAVLEDATELGIKDPYHRGGANYLRWVMGQNPALEKTVSDLARKARVEAEAGAKDEDKERPAVGGP